MSACVGISSDDTGRLSIDSIGFNGKKPDSSKSLISSLETILAVLLLFDWLIVLVVISIVGN